MNDEDLNEGRNDLNGKEMEGEQNEQQLPKHLRGLNEKGMKRKIAQLYGLLTGSNDQINRIY